MALKGLKKEDLEKTTAKEVKDFIEFGTKAIAKKDVEVKHLLRMPESYKDFLDEKAKEVDRSRNYIINKIIKHIIDSDIDIKDIL